ncbi:hypothetical protein [Aromatoleum buckelii]|uniref:Uncharacterized protein n=1 Tax=Aromatoleum buckelii TaxID=200254 RepID=A0ABX1MYR0_9RHOO|nr:hypothetical protein [Aromatoleum buckelii]MCK0510261.1 hypothetical protein [Aromatoleum buckelii]
MNSTPFTSNEARLSTSSLNVQLRFLSRHPLVSITAVAGAENMAMTAATKLAASLPIVDLIANPSCEQGSVRTMWKAWKRFVRGGEWIMIGRARTSLTHRPTKIYCQQYPRQNCCTQEKQADMVCAAP